MNTSIETILYHTVDRQTDRETDNKQTANEQTETNRNVHKHNPTKRHKVAETTKLRESLTRHKLQHSINLLVQKHWQAKIAWSNKMLRPLRIKLHSTTTLELFLICAAYDTNIAYMYYWISLWQKRIRVHCALVCGYVLHWCTICPCVRCSTLIKLQNATNS